MSRTVIITMTNDRTLVWNNDQGWVDRDDGPGPTVFSEAEQYHSALPMGGEWENHDA